jgi:putative membrane protein
MTVSTADRQLPLRDLVDREFQPGELPGAEPTSAAVEELPGRGDGEGRPGLAAWLAMGSAAAIFVLIAASAAVSLAESAVRGGSVLDGLYLAALVVLMGSLIVLVARQTRALRKLKSAERAREFAAGLAKLDGAGSGTRLLGALRAVYSDKPLILGRLNAAAAALQPHHSDRDVIELLDREIFQPMDREADQRIQKAALRAAFGVSSCPHPALDAVVVLVLSMMLIRDLMAIYGLRHSLRSLFRVMTRSLFLASSTALMSTAVEFAMKAAHDRLATAVVGTAGEALVVARRMLALGAIAKAEIRPLPVPLPR